MLGASDRGDAVDRHLIALVAAFVLGRAWCGWICPLGTVLDWPGPQPKLHEVDPRRGCAKSSISSVADPAPGAAGQHDLLILDPSRCSTGRSQRFLPALDALNTAVEPILYKIHSFRAVDASRAPCAAPFCPRPNGVRMGVVLALLFVGILALNLVRDRFWCRSSARWAGSWIG